MHGHGSDLETESDGDENDPDDQEWGDRCRSFGLSGDGRKIQRSGRSVDETDAEQGECRRYAAQQEIFQGSLDALGMLFRQGDQQIKGQGDQFQR